MAYYKHIHIHTCAASNRSNLYSRSDRSPLIKKWLKRTEHICALGYHHTELGYCNPKQNDARALLWNQQTNGTNKVSIPFVYGFLRSARCLVCVVIFVVGFTRCYSDGNCFQSILQVCQLTELKQNKDGKNTQTDSGTSMRHSCQKTWEGTVENGQQAKRISRSGISFKKTASRRISVYIDGSVTKDQAGWGFTVKKVRPPSTKTVQPMRS